MNAKIIAVGTELTIGQVQDTNSHYLSRELDSIGVKVMGIEIVPDDREVMRRAFEAGVSSYEITIVTGGLGPTADDFTKFVLQEMFGGEWCEDKATLAAVVDYFAIRGEEASPRNRSQAQIPSSCEVLFNKLGTAPGMLFRRGDRWLFSLPGVPFEMKAMFAEKVQPLIAARSKAHHFHRTLQVYGIAESDLADKIKDWELSLAPEFALAYLPSPESIRLRISAVDVSTKETIVHAEKKVAELREILGSLLFGEGDESLASAVGKLLLAQRARVATAESCTGGGVSRALVSVPGASAYLKGGIIAYSNVAKETLLGVGEELIGDCGAASGEVAKAMAIGARQALGADYALSTTGVLGPQGDGTCTPVGTVWVGISGPRGERAVKYSLRTSREVAMARSVSHALNTLRLHLLGEL